MPVLPLLDVTTHHDVPVTHVLDYANFTPLSSQGVSRYECPLPRNTKLEALLVNKKSDVLLVALHGATNRDQKELPRFEYFRTLRETSYSSMYFSDPTLWLDKELPLAWYTGWRDFDLYPVIAQWVSSTAKAIGASTVVFLGSSGGGLAALQLSTFLPNSLAIPFSGQSSIDNYYGESGRMNAQKQYLRVVMPHLIPPEGVDSLRQGSGYFASMGARGSATIRYQTGQQNFVYYVQNLNDRQHFDLHYLPFRAAVERGPNMHRVRFELQDDRPGHNPPRRRFLLESLDSALDWVR